MVGVEGIRWLPSLPPIGIEDIEYPKGGNYKEPSHHHDAPTLIDPPETAWPRNRAKVNKT